MPEAQARLEAIWSRVVGDLRQAVREMRVTEDELHLAAEYLTRAGDARVMRSLLDAALSMASMDARAGNSVATRANPEGPYYNPNVPIRADGNLLEAEPSKDAEMLRVCGRVVNAQTNQPLPGAVLHVWQANEHGSYDLTGTHLRGRIVADEDGHFVLTTVVPSDYEEHDDDPIGELYHAMGRTNYRAAHIHVKVFVGETEVLTTQLYMSDSENLSSDYVEGAVSGDLVVQRVNGADGIAEGAFDFAVIVPEPQAHGR